MANLLPKKSWHVLNKDNIDKVRKDEKLYEEENTTKEERRRENESNERLSSLKEKAGVAQKARYQSPAQHTVTDSRPTKTVPLKETDTFGRLKADSRWYEHRFSRDNPLHGRSESKRLEMEDPLSVIQKIKDSKRTKK